jgi:tripartite ATP-independent transporter DctP family solute receptor
MKRAIRLSVFLVVLLCVTVLGAVAEGQAETTGGEQESLVLRLAELNPEQDPVTQAFYEFSEIVAERSDGRIDVRVFPSGQLGPQTEVLQALQTGAIDITRANPANLRDLGIDKIGVFSLPYIFEDSDHAWRVIQGDVGDEILSAIDDSSARLVGLTFMLASPRSFFFRNAEVTSVSDMQGLKLRVPNADIYLEMVEALGASPTPIAYSELYSALQTGVVDGAENPIKGYFNNNFYEVADHYTFNRHILEPTPMVVSKVTWDRLSDGDKEILYSAAQEASEFYRDELASVEEEYMTQLRDRGVEFHQVDNPNEWVEAVQPLYEKYGAGNEQLIEDIMSLR